MTDRGPEDADEPTGAEGEVGSDFDVNEDDLPPIALHTGEGGSRRYAPILAGAGLALAVLAGLELLLTITLGLAVPVDQLSRVSRIGYAFLTQMEKSPLGVVLVVAAIVTAVAAKTSEPASATERRAGLAAGLILGFAVVLGIGAVLALVARFDVADVMESQRVDGVTRRVLAIFVVRNLGAAAVAFVVASTVVRSRGGNAPDRA